MVEKLSRDVVLQRLKDIRDMQVGGLLPPWLVGRSGLPIDIWFAGLIELAGAAVDYLEDEYEYEE